MVDVEVGTGLLEEAVVDGRGLGGCAQHLDVEVRPLVPPAGRGRPADPHDVDVGIARGLLTEEGGALSMRP